MKKIFLLLISTLIALGVMASTPPTKIPSGSRAQRIAYSIPNETALAKASKSINSKPMKENGEGEEENDMVMVSFNFDYNEDEYEVGLDIYWFNPVFGTYDFVQINESSPFTYLPTHTPLTMVCTFINISDAMVPIHAYIVKEDIMVEEGMEITFNPNDANNEIDFTSYYPDGTQCVLPKYYVDPRTGEEEWDLEGANTFFIWFDCLLYIEGIGENSSSLCGGTGYVDRRTGFSGERFFNLKINDVSEKVRFFQSRYVVPMDENNYLNVGDGSEYVLIPLEARGSETEEINNLGTPSLTYSLKDNLINTPDFDIDNCIAHTEKIIPFSIFNTRIKTIGMNLQTVGDNPKVTIFEPSIANPLNRVGASVAKIEKEEYNEYEELQQYGVFSLPIINNYGELTYVATSSIPDMADFRPLKNWMDKGSFSPSYEAFNTPVGLGLKIGSSFPVNTTFIEEMRTASQTPVFVPQPTFIGTMGELRDIDLLSVQASIEVDGTQVVDSYDGYKEWIINRAENDHEKGKVSFVFDNGNYKIGDFEGLNHTVMTYDENNPEGDYFPPVLGMLRLIDPEGNVREYFKDGRDIILELTAGDFHSNRGQYFKQMPVSSVNVLVAPNGSSEFSPITVTENPDKTSQTAGYGFFYETSPEGFGSLEKGVYDLMVTLEDQNGNTSRQLISPAFVIGEPTNKVINETGTHSNNGKVYNLSGTLVLDNAKVEDMNALSPGIYIFHTDRGTMKHIVR